MARPGVRFKVAGHGKGSFRGHANTEHKVDYSLKYSQFSARSKKSRIFAKRRIDNPLKVPCSYRMNRIAVALFSERAQAEPVRQRLVQAGCPAEIEEELWLQKLWYVSKRSAGARLKVPADQLERAERLLLSWDMADGALRDAIRCPECKSLRVVYPQFARNSLMTNVAAGFLAEAGLVEKDYYCEHCQYTWPKAEAHPSPKRGHMAPFYFIEDVAPTARPIRAQSHASPEPPNTL